MSPLTQLNSRIGYGSGIDRNFSPIFNFFDEFDRHFSHRHRFMNCFIPRFDLEEDAANFYLFGEIPGAKVEDITIEAQDNHTLTIYGSTHREGAVPVNQQTQGSRSEKEEEAFVNVPKEEGSGEQQQQAPAQEEAMMTGTASKQDQAPHHHLRHSTNNIQNSNYTPAPEDPSLPTPYPHPNPPVNAAGRQVLLSERLVGEFHRTFAFPAPVDEQGVKASVDNGVLRVVVPKTKVEQGRRGRKVPILSMGTERW